MRSFKIQLQNGKYVGFNEGGIVQTTKENAYGYATEQSVNKALELIRRPNMLYKVAYFAKIVP